MRYYLPFILFGLCLTQLSCGDSVGNTSTDRKPAAFYHEEVTISADTDKVVPGRETIITLRCLPLLSGRGRMTFYGAGGVNGTRLYIDSPVQDTLIRGTKDTASINVEFVANQPFEQQWRVRFEIKEYYYLHASTVLDSVFIADSARLYPIDSDVVVKSSPGGFGYLKSAGDYFSLTLPP